MQFEIALAATTSGGSPVTSMPNGLVGYWTFDGIHTNWRNGITYDQSGQGNNGTLTNMSTSTSPTVGKLGQSLRFDGVDDYIPLADSALLSPGSGNFAVSAWFKTNSPAATQSIYSNFGATAFLLFRVATTARFLSSDDASHGGNAVGATTLLPGVWYHVVGVRSGVNTHIYLNGVLDGTGGGNLGTLTLTGGTAPAIGRQNNAGSQHFNGLIDDVRIYNRALTVTEVQKLYTVGEAKFSNSPVSMQKGLVGYWTFDGQNTNWAKGITYDRSGFGSNGTLISMSTSTTPTTGKLGQALKFDGINDYIDLGDPLAIRPGVGIGSAITMSAWIKMNTNGNNQTIISKNDSGFPNNETQLRYQAGTGVNCIIGGNSTNFSIILSANVWYNVACVYDGANYMAYVDGREIGRTAKTGAIADDAGVNWTIGARTATSPAIFMNGSLDDVRIYNRALSAIEMREMYNLGSAKFGNSPVTEQQKGLIGYWTFDGPQTNWTKGLTYDQSGFKNDGTLTSMSTSTTPIAGKFGQGLNFDGVDDIVVIPDTNLLSFTDGADNDRPFSISVWVRPPVAGVGDGIVSKSTTFNTGEFYLHNGGSTQNLLFRIVDQSTGGYFGVLTGNVMTVSTWNHVVATYDASETNAGMKIYVNGVLVPVSNTNLGSYVGMENTTTNLYFGRRTSFFPGGLDDVRIYNRVLSTKEIQELYLTGGK